MRSMEALVLCLAAAASGFAQGVSIKGVVKDAAGSPVAGVLLKLEKSGYQTASGADGTFTLAEGATSLAPLAPSGEVRSVLSFDAQGRLLFARLPGRAVARERAWPHFGFQALRVETGARGPRLAKASVSAGFRDVVLAGKSGFLNYRVGVNAPSVTGLEIRLIAAAGSVTDADGNAYQTVRLGNQEWTVEHFRCTKYNNGAAIPLIPEQSQWNARTSPAMCYPGNMTNPDSIRKWGALYNWHAVNTKKLAPAGWRVPSDADWMALQNHLIGAGFNHDGTTTGNKIGKAMAAQTDWAGSTAAGAVGNDQAKNNRSGFNGMPIGFRDRGGTFTSRGTRCIMSSTDNKEGLYGWFADIDNASAGLRYSDDWMSMGFAIRLVKGNP